MRKLFYVILSAVFACALLAGCQVQEQTQSAEADTSYRFFYMNTEETKLMDMEYLPEEETAEYMLPDLMGRLNSVENPVDGIHLLPEGVQINSYEIQDSTLQVAFNSRYGDMSRARELLVRAGVVKTFLQVPGIESVKFLVGKSELRDTKEQPVGEMTAGTFVEFSGSDEDSYRYDTFTLYFTDRTGTKLVAEERNVRYKRNIAKETVVLEQLAKGPMVKGHYPTIPESCSVLSILTADGVCYAEFDTVFLDNALDVAEDIPIYSVVNSLLAATGLEKAEISIDGETEVIFGQNMDLYSYFQWNESLIVPEKEIIREEEAGDAASDGETEAPAEEKASGETSGQE